MRNLCTRIMKELEPDLIFNTLAPMFLSLIALKWTHTLGDNIYNYSTSEENILSKRFIPASIIPLLG